MKKIISTALIALFSVVLLTGCTNSHKDELKQAFGNTASWKSFKSSYNINAVLDATGGATQSSLSQDMSFSGVLEVNDKKGHVELNIPAVLSVYTSVSGNMVMYYEYTTTDVIVYMYDGTTWTAYKQAIPATALGENSDTTATATPTSLISSYSTVFNQISSDFIQKTNYVADEKVDDVDCYKYEITLEWDMLIDMMKKAAEANPEASQELAANSASLSLIKTQLASITPAKMTIWVDKTNIQLKKIKLDVVDTINKLAKQYDTSSSSSSYNFTKMNFEITFSDINKVDDIIIPDAAKKAKIIESSPTSTDGFGFLN